MIESTAIHQNMIAKLATRSALDSEDRAAIEALPVYVRDVRASSYLIEEGQQATRCVFLNEGFVYRQKLTTHGARQIVSVQIPGDFVDLQNLFLKRSDHSIQALTGGTIAEIPVDAMRALALGRPGVGRAMWIDALVDASLAREWVLNVGRRDARGRVAHLICEFSVRLQAAGIAEGVNYALPMTQEQIGDATGLTAVHVNRTLRTLTEGGMIGRNGQQITIRDEKALRTLAGFSAGYLHLDQAA